MIPGASDYVEDNWRIQEGIQSMSVAGSINSEEIYHSLVARKDNVEACYENLNTTNRTGTITVKFMVSSKGRVTNITLESCDFDDDKMKSCIKEALSNITFPKAMGGSVAVIRYPFVFKPM